MTVWMVGDCEFEDMGAAAREIVSQAGTDAYDEMLDEMYGDVDICGNEYPVYAALKEIDPTAYRCGFADWESEIVEEIEDRLENMGDGDKESFWGIEVSAVEEEPEEDGGQEDW